MRPFVVEVLERNELRRMSLVGVSDKRAWRRFARRLRQHTYKGFRIEKHSRYGIPAIIISDLTACAWNIKGRQQ